MAAGISQTLRSMTDLTGMVDANLPKQARSLFRSEAAMIKQEHGVYIASCDRCGQTINTGQKSMQQAANYLSRCGRTGYRPLAAFGAISALAALKAATLIPTLTVSVLASAGSRAWMMTIPNWQKISN